MSKSPAALALLALLGVAIAASHVQPQQVDGHWVVAVSGRPVDAWGLWRQQLNTWRRDCSAVHDIAPGQALHQDAWQTLHDYAPPHSHSAQLHRLQQLGPWLLAQAAFDDRPPVVALLHGSPGAWAVWPQGLWSGSTHPLEPGPFIRDYLQARSPEAPAALWACLDPAPALWPRPGQSAARAHGAAR